EAGQAWIERLTGLRDDRVQLDGAPDRVGATSLGVELVIQALPSNGEAFRRDVRRLPALGVTGGDGQRPRSDRGDPDRWARMLNRLRLESGIAQRVPRASMVEADGGPPESADDLDRFFERLDSLTGRRVTNPEARPASRSSIVL